VRAAAPERSLEYTYWGIVRLGIGFVWRSVVEIPKANYPWQAPYFIAVCEDNFSLLPMRVKEALKAVEERLKSPVQPGSKEDLALNRAKTGLLALQAGQTHNT
jgi:hypothetical protein